MTPTPGWKAGLAEDIAALFSPAYYTAYAAASRYAAGLLARSLEELASGPACAPHMEPVLAWGRRFIAALPGPRQERPTDPFLTEGLPLLELAAATWPGVLRGEVDGLVALFRGERITYWERYFSPGHTLYDVHNRLGAAVAAALLEPGQVVLELGAGLGSAARALAATAEAAGVRPAAYGVTDANRRFAQRAARALSREMPALNVWFAAVDFDRALTDQGIAPQSQDLVYACNALHCAADLLATLREIRRVLRPGGHLVLSECARPTVDSVLHQEMIFLLLDSYRNVRLDPVLRPVCGFLLPENWLALLEEVGFRSVGLVTNQLSPGDPLLGVVVWGTA